MPTTITGTSLTVGSIDLTTPLATADGGTGGTGFVGFSAYASVATSLTASTPVKVGFQTEEYDTTSAYDTSTSKFTPQVQGYYSVKGAVDITTVANVKLSVWKNGVLYKEGAVVISGLAAGCYVDVYLNGSTDYIELYSTQFSATQNSSTGAAYNYFQAALISRT